MAITYFFAQFYGTILTIAGFALLINRRQMIEIMREAMNSRALLFVVGIMSLIFGTFFVLVNNIWTGGFLPVVTTLVGWIILVRGALIILLPHGTLRRVFNAIHIEQAYWVITLIVLVVGIYLAWSGFSIY